MQNSYVAFLKQGNVFIDPWRFFRNEKFSSVKYFGSLRNFSSFKASSNGFLDKRNIESIIIKIISKYKLYQIVSIQDQ